MAVGDRVAATKNIQTVVMEGLTAVIKANGIPSGENGTIEVEDPIQGVVSVLFDNGVRGNFGDTLVDKLTSIVVLPVETKARDMMAEERTRLAAEAAAQTDILPSR